MYVYKKAILITYKSYFLSVAERREDTGKYRYKKKKHNKSENKNKKKTQRKQKEKERENAPTT